MIGDYNRKYKILKDFANWYRNLRPFKIRYENRKDSDIINWYKYEREKIKKFKNIHEGEDCFIIGNGPSLNNIDLERLNDYHTFGLNKIYLIFERLNLNLSYHVVVNPLVIEQIINEIQTGVFGCPTFASYNTAIKDIKCDHLVKLDTKNRLSFYEDITTPICEGHTVTYVAMQIAYFMGFKNVFLLGVDHNFVQNGNPNEEKFHENDDVNHFHPDYFKGNFWHLADLESSELSYRIAKHYYSRSGRQIFDATLNGKLEIFDKITYEEALNMAVPKKA